MSEPTTEVQALIRIASDACREDVNGSDIEKARHILDWQRKILVISESSNLDLKQSVKELEQYLTEVMVKPNNSSARMYASQMLSQLPTEWIVFETVEQWLVTINYLITHTPEYSSEKSERVFFPISKVFVFFMLTRSGSALFRMDEFNRRMKGVLEEWCNHLDSKESRLVLNPNRDLHATGGWLSLESQKEFCLEQCANYKFKQNASYPYWNFQSFNHFFHRKLNLDKYRPMGVKIDDDGTDLAIVSANDGTVYRICENVDYKGKFWIKGQEFSLFDMMGGSVDLTGRTTALHSIEEFIGGDVIQSFLSGSDYHRWHAPISGTVIEARVINGMTFSSLLAEGTDLDAGVLSQGYAAMVNTRGLVIIDNSKLGKVAVIPIGITEISSVNLCVEKGQKIEKGDELGYFSYGGSSLAIVFQDGMVQKFTVKVPQDEHSGYVQKNEFQQHSNCKTENNCDGKQGCLMVRATIAITHKKSRSSTHFATKNKKRKIR